MYLKRLSTLIVFLMVVSSLVFLMRARHLTESIIPFYLANCQTGESPNMLFKCCPTGTKISRCVYAGEGRILLFSVLLMGFVKAAFCRLTCLRGRSQLSTFMKAYTAYARGEGVWDLRTLFLRKSTFNFNH